MRSFVRTCLAVSFLAVGTAAFAAGEISSGGAPTTDAFHAVIVFPPRYVAPANAEHGFLTELRRRLGEEMTAGRLAASYDGTLVLERFAAEDNTEERHVVCFALATAEERLAKLELTKDFVDALPPPGTDGVQLVWSADCRWNEIISYYRSAPLYPPQELSVALSQHLIAEFTRLGLPHSGEWSLIYSFSVGADGRDHWKLKDFSGGIREVPLTAPIARQLLALYVEAGLVSHRRNHDPRPEYWDGGIRCRGPSSCTLQRYK